MSPKRDILSEFQNLVQFYIIRDLIKFNTIRPLDKNEKLCNLPRLFLALNFYVQW